jgi:hypothetical protein
MKRILTLLSILVIVQVCSAAIVDEYTLKMYVYVPRIYNNTESQGYRKYQRQIVQGTLKLTYEGSQVRPTITITNLVNKTQKVSSGYITYTTAVDQGTFIYPRINVIGNNRTGIFKTGSLVFYIDANPSYNVGEDDEDNSLLVVLAGKSTTKATNGRRVLNICRGNLAGTLGCGCMSYGHTSPTRVMGSEGPTDDVDDVAAVFGTWIMRYTRSYVTN